jgi:hypothetical protein
VGRVTLAGVLGLVAAAMRWTATSRDPGIWLAVVAPVLWTLPFWLVVHGPRRIPRAQVRTAS